MAQAERTELSPVAEQRITEAVRSLAEDQVERGVDINRPMRCDSCDADKSPYGSSRYGEYALCNDCLLEFTLLLARGDVDTVADYMTKQPDDSIAHVDHSPSTLELQTPRALPKRAEKLVPSNEPA